MAKNFYLFLSFLGCIIMVDVANGQSTYNQEIKQVGISLYSSFSKMQNISGRLDFSDTARLKWNNLPVGLRPRVGTSIGNMTEEQRKLVHRLLSVSLSSHRWVRCLKNQGFGDKSEWQ